MQPVLFSVFGIDVQTYGVSKALAALVAAYLLGRAFERAGLKKDHAHDLVFWATVWGFVGAKVYFLLEQAAVGTVTLHDLGGMGFTWYGGLISGLIAAMVIIRRHHLPIGIVAGATAIPLTVAYGIGRLGCFLSGDGTYGQPSSLPWAMAFPNGVVATDVPVHPTPLYEASAAVVVAGILWGVGTNWAPPAVFGAYLGLSGAVRFLVEMVRTNDPVMLGLTQPQLWSVVSILAGAIVIARTKPLLLATGEPSPTRRRAAPATH